MMPPMAKKQLPQETFVDHLKAGDEGHWRTFYARWDDGDFGVTPQEVVSLAIDRLTATEPGHPALEYLGYAVQLMVGREIKDETRGEHGEAS